MRDTDNKPRNKNEVEIDIIPLLKALLSKLWLMVLVGVVIGVIAFGATKMLVKPTYRSGFSAYVNNQHAQSTEKSVLTNSDLAAAQQLTKTLSYIIRSNTILTASLKSIDSDITYDQLSGMVSTEIKNDTELITVYVVNRDPQTAYDLANAIAKTAPSYMADIVEGSSMKIVDYPVYPETRYKPSYFQYGIFGFIFGVLVVAIILIIRYFRDDSVKDDSELETKFSIPVLGVIPDINNVGQKNGYYKNNYSYAYAKPQDKEEKK